MAGCSDIRSIIPMMLLSLILPLTFNQLQEPEPDDGKCELIGTFSLLTQACLGLLCLSSLIIKRFYEYPIRRTWPVWVFDVAKQLIGALGVHIFNVLLSVAKTEDDFTGQRQGKRRGNGDSDTQDPCDWYFLNIVFDCTIGVYILYLVFKLMNRIAKKYFKITQIESGEYGPDPNKPSTRAFFKQLLVYFTSLMITKVILYGVMECFETQLLWITSHVLLVWLDEYPDEFEIFIVMFVVPIFMNCLQLILIDNFIRNQLWTNTNKRIKIEYPNFRDDTESVLRQEIAEILEQEERELLEQGETTPTLTPVSRTSRKSYGSIP
ncbi:Vacuolar membrane protein [Spathaspora sp. JA1]|nr:Vacuolar membrane protein [Spathaspora sp. JA1]